MAEISETPQTIDKLETSEMTEPLNPKVEFDPETMRRRTKPKLKRLILIITVLASFISGFPFLLKTIEIYRSRLPFHDIDSISNNIKSNPVYLPCRFQVVFLGYGISDDVQKLGFMISEEMVKLTGNNNPICGGCGKNYTVSVTIDSGKDCIRNLNYDTKGLWHCGAFDYLSVVNGDLKDDDEAVDDLLYSALWRDEDSLDSGGKVYTVVVMNMGDDGSKIVVGKYRHAWMLGRISVINVVSTSANIFVKSFMNGGKEEGLVHGEFMPVGADGRTVLSFSLLNANPQDWIYDWDFLKIDEELLAPVVEALAPIANLSVESQVLYHTPKSSYSYWDAKLSSHIFSTKDLPFFVNSNEWHLDTSIAAGGRSKVLQFVVYIPSAEECPLLLQLPSGEISKTNGFISPMWGGVLVWNPPSCFRTPGNRPPVKHTFSPQLHFVSLLWLSTLICTYFEAGSTEALQGFHGAASTTFGPELQSDDDDDDDDVDDVDVAKRVYQIAYYLRLNDTEDEDVEERDLISPSYYEDVLDELQGYVGSGSIDIAEELHSVNALVPLLYNVMFHKHAVVRAKAAEAVTTMVQNNPRSQLLVLVKGDGLPSLLYNISDPDVTARTKALGAISALLRNNHPGITAFGPDGGYEKLRDVLSTETDITFQRDALNLIQYLLHENSSVYNIVTKLRFPLILTHLASSDDAEVREAALRVLLVLARYEGGNSGQLVKNDDNLKQVLQERIEGISAMAPEDLGAAREEIQLVDSLWNACYNKPSSLREKGLLTDAPEPIQHS